MTKRLSELSWSVLPATFSAGRVWLLLATVVFGRTSPRCVLVGGLFTAVVFGGLFTAVVFGGLCAVLPLEHAAHKSAATATPTMGLKAAGRRRA
jgi:hypothetical protein